VNEITFLVRIKSVKKTAPNTVNVGTGITTKQLALSE
jgi:hypothetical protein